ncbi:MAG TPA: hypothetical protein VFO90_06625 [Terrimicrobiaceae bacterium]|nr:hypothetical protein [Terrimicrobiaceae bacterium]
MNLPHSVLVAFAHDGLRSALNVVEALEPLADVQLCSYDQLHQRPPQEPDVALCIVTDEESLDLAHEFQVRLEDVPTLVVDGAGGLKIEVNGYAGRISSAPDQVVRAVRHLLVPDAKRDSRTLRKSGIEKPARRISSPFDQTLARTAGGEQTPQAILIAASQQLSWDLRADRVEVFLRAVEKNAFRKVHAEPESSSGTNGAPCPEVVRLIKKRPHPVTLSELEGRSARPLHDYLTSRNLNLIIPLAKETRLLGWLAFGLEASRCTDDLLDDLQIAGRLLTTSVADAFNRETQNQEAKAIYNALSALKSGILTIDQEGAITSITGATPLLGSDPQKGDHFKAIHNSRVREVVALALRGDFVERFWTDFDSQETLSTSSTKLPDGKVAVFWGPFRSQEKGGSKQGGMELKEVLESLPVPVLLGNEVSPGGTAVPQGRITNEDSQAIMDCALQAQARNVKALRLRWGQRQSSNNAVLFYDSRAEEGSEEFSDDIKQAVRFSLLAA